MQRKKRGEMEEGRRMEEEGGVQEEGGEGMKERSPVTVAMIPITCTHRERAIKQAFTA